MRPGIPLGGPVLLGSRRVGTLDLISPSRNGGQMGLVPGDWIIPHASPATITSPHA